MNRIALGLGAGLVALVLAGCPPTYPKCSNDEQCQTNNEVCVQGQCQQCATDAHCQEGFVCQQTRCVPKPECTDDAACGAGKTCQAGKCTLAPGACLSDGDCSGGGKCKNNQCLAPGACTETGDCGVNEKCEANQCVAAEETAACNWNPVRFGFNEYTLSSEAQQQLSTLADCLKKEGGSLTVAGHADERGTEEYNLQLSNRRAEAVRRYLSDLGASGVKAVGYGETQPANPGSSEEAWEQNRRVEFQR